MYSMYTPTHFKEEKTDVLHRFIRDNSFGTFITYDKNGKLHASEINLVLEENEGQVMLYGHVAQANAQAEQIFNDPKALAIFRGPHAYVSPAWYINKDVPTWNYTVVHAHGSVKPITDKEKLKVTLDKLVSKFESKKENPSKIPWDQEKYSIQLDGIVGFEMQVSRLEGKFKLSQNRTRQERENIVKNLAGSCDQNERDVSCLMRSKL